MKKILLVFLLLILFMCAYSPNEQKPINNVDFDDDVICYICTICGLQYTHNTWDTEHHFVLIEAVPATCTEDGYYLYRYKITGEEKIGNDE